MQSFTKLSLAEGALRCEGMGLCSAINGIHHFLNDLILDLVTRKRAYARVYPG